MSMKNMWAGALAGAVAAMLVVTALRPAAQQAPPIPPPPALPTGHAGLIEDLVAANRALVQQGVLDAWGHVSVRDDRNPQRYLIARSLAPELVTAADIMEFDLDSNPLDRRGPDRYGPRYMYDERFVHGAIYKARPDVKAIVHSHSPAIVPFTLSDTELKPVFHMSFFLSGGVPNYEIRKYGGMTDLLVRNNELANGLAETLGDRPVALMRGHGAVVVAEDVATAVGRSIFLEFNAKTQAAAMALGGKVTYIDPEEARLRVRPNQYIKGWEIWRRKALETLKQPS
jgi:ribulose-5-phosphate 4-epimerase/fuculose-1-phosphate aldolase